MLTLRWHVLRVRGVLAAGRRLAAYIAYVTNIYSDAAARAKTYADDRNDYNNLKKQVENVVKIFLIINLLHFIKLNLTNETSVVSKFKA